MVCGLQGRDIVVERPGGVKWLSSSQLRSREGASARAEGLRGQVHPQGQAPITHSSPVIDN